jgi:L-asparaginase
MSHFITIEVEYKLIKVEYKVEKTNMEKLLIINSGGTFNKVYNPLKGTLDIEKSGIALKNIADSWLTTYTVVNIIGKDSLEMTEEDREEIVQTIYKHRKKKIIIVHGTDTIDQTAAYLAAANLHHDIVLTGAMVPYAIDPIEATANFASAYGYLMASNSMGVYIAMNGVIKDYKRVIKNKEKGYFEQNSK